MADKPPRAQPADQSDQEKNKVSHYDPIPPARPIMSEQDKQNLTDGYVQSVRDMLGNYVRKEKDVNDVPYYVYEKNGVERAVRPGKDAFTYSVKPDKNTPFQDWEVPQADVYRGFYKEVAGNRNPWDPEKGWGKDVSQMTMGEIQDAANQSRAFTQQPNILGPGEIQALNQSNAMIKDMATARDVIGNLDANDLNVFTQGVGKLASMMNMSPEQLSGTSPSWLSNKLIPYVAPDILHKITRLQTVLLHLANDGANIAGLPQDEKSPTAGLTSHFSDLLADYGLLQAGKGGKGASPLVTAGALKGIGAFASALVDGQIDVNKIREGLGGSVNEARQMFHANTQSLVQSGYRVPQNIRDNANTRAQEAEAEGVGPEENPFEVSARVPTRDQGSQEFTPIKPVPQNPQQHLMEDGTPSENAATPPSKPTDNSVPAAPIRDPGMLYLNKLTPSQVMPFQVAPIAPSEQNQASSSSKSPALPHLTEQEHVDGLEPGAAFTWRDHPEPYVRV
jgi:hypothetical protein